MNVKPLIFLLPLAALFVTCKKDDPKPEEKPILSLLQQSSIVIDTVAAPVEWVYGFTFKVKSDGIITKIGMKLPVTGTYTAKLWDMDENKVIREVTLTGASVHQEVFEDFDDVAVTEDMTLGVSITANGYYKISKADATPFAFPIQTTGTTILSFHEDKLSDIPSGIFPLTINQQELSPCVDVVFIDQ